MSLNKQFSPGSEEANMEQGKRERTALDPSRTNLFKRINGKLIQKNIEEFPFIQKNKWKNTA